MQIEIAFTCRECEIENALLTDTSNYGFISDSGDTSGLPVQNVEHALALDLRCFCGHVSGEIAMGYRFLPEHRPSIEVTIPRDVKG